MSFWRLYYHLVWSTKNRLPIIAPEIEAQLFSYIIRRATETGSYVIAVNGYTDHMHLVVTIPPELSIAEYVKLIKGSSSHYVNYTLQPSSNFAWQRGYGVLSMGEKQRQIAVDYVNNQKQHHENQSTISLLERSSSLSEGPDISGINAEAEPDRIHEVSGYYSTEAESPI